ncbi:hypothetical protein EON65_52605 [archaeon]|nr:MAG: hypothetical protein EON65_52605 [archaeon]
MQSQPLYIKGPEDTAKAAQGCYQGGRLRSLPSLWFHFVMSSISLYCLALIYLATFCFSVIYWILDTLKKKAVAALSSTPSNPTMPSSGQRTRTQGSKKYGALETE